MQEAPLPEDEVIRLEALKGYAILDTLPEQAYDDIAHLASQICDTPVAIVSLVDEDRQWFKSHQGLEISETPRNIAFCAHAILDPDKLLIVEDALLDERFSDNPLVTADPPIRFYAGAPLVTSQGHALGTICVIDREPRVLEAGQKEALGALSRQVIAQLELRRTALELEHHAEQLGQSHDALERRNQQLQRSRAELAGLVELLRNQAEVIQRDLHRAEVIQRSLLPHDVPPMDRFNVQTLYLPGQTIGGDLYDVVGIADRYLALVVADASGHGVSAAMLSVLFKHHLQLQNRVTGTPYRPGEALKKINGSMLADRLTPGAFITAAVCLLDTEERTLIISSAGHPPLLWVKTDGTFQELGHTGPALGLDVEAQFKEHTLRLDEGDRVLLYTDGLMDICATAPGIGSIAELLHAHKDDSDALEALLLEVTHGQTRRDGDDVTMVLLNAAPGESNFSELANSLDLKPLPIDDRPTMTRGETPEASVLVLGGRVTWLFGQVLFDTAMSVLDARRDLVIDLGACEHMDSTLLGTLHELTQRARGLKRRCVIQNADQRLLDNFEELAMEAVTASITDRPIELPEQLTQIDLSKTDVDRQQQRLLKAHEVLASLSEENEEQFGSLIESLRTELR